MSSHVFDAPGGSRATSEFSNTVQEVGGGSDAGIRMLDRLQQRQRRAALAGNQRAGAYAKRNVRALQRMWLRQQWWKCLVVLVPFAGLVVLAHLFLWHPLFPYVTGAIAASALWVPYHLMSHSFGIGSWQVGAGAEEWTAQEVRRLHRGGWFVVNHVTTDRGDVDHVVGGPGGFFALETKFRGDWSDRSTDLDSMARQAQSGALKAAARMQLGAKARATPVVVLWGMNGKTLFPEPVERGGVVFTYGADLRSFLTSRPPTVPADDIDRAYRNVDAYASKVDATEIATQGPVPRPLLEPLNRVSLIVLAGLVAAFPVLWTMHLRPIGWWSALTATAIIVLAFWLRHRTTQLLARYITTAAISGAALPGAVALVFAVLEQAGVARAR